MRYWKDIIALGKNNVLTTRHAFRIGSRNTGNYIISSDELSKRANIILRSALEYSNISDLPKSAIKFVQEMQEIDKKKAIVRDKIYPLFIKYRKESDPLKKEMYKKESEENDKRLFLLEKQYNNVLDKAFLLIKQELSKNIIANPKSNKATFKVPKSKSTNTTNPAGKLAGILRNRTGADKRFKYYGKNIDYETAMLILKKNGITPDQFSYLNFKEIQEALNQIHNPGVFGAEDELKKMYMKPKTVNRYASIMAEGPARKSNNQIEASNRYASIASEGPARKSINKIEPSNRYTSIANEPALKKVVQQVLPSNRYTSIVQEPITKKQAQELQAMLRRIPESDVQARESLIKHQMKKYRLRAGDSLPLRLKRLQTYNKFLYNWLSY